MAVGELLRLHVVVKISRLDFVIRLRNNRGILSFGLWRISSAASAVDYSITLRTSVTSVLSPGLPSHTGDITCRNNRSIDSNASKNKQKQNLRNR